MNCSCCGHEIDLSMVSDLWLKTRDENLTVDLDRSLLTSKVIIEELRAVVDERLKRKYQK